MSVEVRGIVEVQRNLEKVGEDIKEAARQGVMTAAENIAEEARALCPVDTGRLQASIDYRLNWSGETVSAEIFADTEYAGYVEFGTRYMAPRYYMTRAFQNYAARYAEDVSGAVEGVLK